MGQKARLLELSWLAWQLSPAPESSSTDWSVLSPQTLCTSNVVITLQMTPRDKHGQQPSAPPNPVSLTVKSERQENLHFVVFERHLSFEPRISEKQRI